MTASIQQLAVATPNVGEAIKAFAKAGFGEWTVDVVNAKMVMGTDPEVHDFQAELAFNYDLMGDVEFELISPLTTPSYIEGDEWFGKIAHVGIHVDSQEESTAARNAYGLAIPVMECWTTYHDNPAVGTTRYHYRIYESTWLPWRVKLIERITEEQAQAVPAGQNGGSS